MIIEEQLEEGTPAVTSTGGGMGVGDIMSSAPTPLLQKRNTNRGRKALSSEEIYQRYQMQKAKTKKLARRVKTLEAIIVSMRMKKRTSSSAAFEGSLVDDDENDHLKMMVRRR
jgi:hypothetical protein